MYPSDIQEKEFSKGVRGYKEEEVDAFLDLIADEFARLLDENDKLKRSLAENEKRIEGYKAQEGAMLNTLEAARALMGDISASAERRAEILIKNAELDAEFKQKQAMDAVFRLKEEERNLAERVRVTRVKFKELLESELARFDSLSEELMASTTPATSDYTPSYEGSSETFSDADIFASLDAHQPSESLLAADPQDLTQTLNNFRR